MVFTTNRSRAAARSSTRVHRLDLALWLMDYPEPVVVSGATYSMGKELAARQQEFDG